MLIVVFGYGRGWGLPSLEDRRELERLMRHISTGPAETESPSDEAATSPPAESETAWPWQPAGTLE